MAKELVVVLEQASLFLIKIEDGYQLLNADKHKQLILKKKINPSHIRPDIIHHCLLMLLDSPLNKSGKLQIFIMTSDNVLIKVDPRIRIPRTFPRFAGLMVQLLQKLSVQASDSSVKLMKTIKNPVTDHLPSNCRIVGLSLHSPDLQNDLSTFISSVDQPIVFVIGAMSQGSISTEMCHQLVSISEFHLSAATICDRVCEAAERAWRT